VNGLKGKRGNTVSFGRAGKAIALAWVLAVVVLYYFFNYVAVPKYWAIIVRLASAVLGA